jgi:maltose alpha-D-glucosyltransferase/alpha-amylase
MQWNPDRNAGFSNADPGKLYLPVVQSLVYHYNHVNVEAQTAHTSSLLHWNKQILQIRKAHPAFGLGRYEPVITSNESVLAFLRVLPVGNEEGESPETMLCVFNLSQHPASTTVHLPSLAGRGLRDVFGGDIFPGVREDGDLTLTLGSYDFFWLRVRSQSSNVLSTQTQAMPVIDGSEHGY